MNPPPEGWYVEIEHPESGHVFRPSVVGSPKRRPKVNDLPTLRVPVERDQKWTDSSLEKAPMRVWYNGRRQPCEILDAVRTTQSKTELVGVGGVQFRDDVEVEYNSKPIHLAVQQLVDNHTDYGWDIDAPKTNERSDVTVQSASTTTEFKDKLNQPLSSTKPLKIENDEVRLLKSCWFINAYDVGPLTRDADAESVGGNVSSRRLSNTGTTLKMSEDSDYLTAKFKPEYTIPAGEARVGFRWGNPSGISGSYGANIYMDGVQIGEIYQGSYINSGNWKWGDWGSTQKLQAGVEHTVTMQITQASGDIIYVDCLAPYDDRYQYYFDNSVNSNHKLAGPESYPDSVTLEFKDAETTRSVDAAKVTSDWNNVEQNQQLALSNDLGVTFQKGNNVEDFEVDFSAQGPSVRLKVQLSRYGQSGSTNPTRGYRGQVLKNYEISADLTDTPVVVDTRYDDSLLNILKDLARQGDFVFEWQQQSLPAKRPDDEVQVGGGAKVGSAIVGQDKVGVSGGTNFIGNKDSGGDGLLVWTQLGQRQSVNEPEVADYASEKSTSDLAEKVTVYGQSITTNGEEFVADTSAAVPLSKGNLLAGKEQVEDPDTGEKFSRGSDYEMDYTNGEISVLSAGDMVDGSSYQISYNYNTRGTYTVDSAGADPESRTIDISALTTNRGCQQAARVIAETISEPRWKTKVTVPIDDDFSTVAEIDFSEIPTNGNILHIRSIENTPQNTVITLGSRLSRDEIVQKVRESVNKVTRKV